MEFNFQLIPYGLNDPWLHLATAKTLAHPAVDDTCIRSDIQNNMEYASSAQMGLVHDRIQAVKWLRDQVRSLEDATKQARDSACKGFQTRNSPLNHGWSLKPLQRCPHGPMGPRRAFEELVVLHGQHANF